MIMPPCNVNYNYTALTLIYHKLIIHISVTCGGNMETVIEKIYENYIQKYSETDTASQEKKAIYEKYRTLRQKLPADLVQELDMLMEKQTEILCGELKENFAEGFRAGVKLIKEVYLEEIPDLEEKIRKMV